MNPYAFGVVLYNDANPAGYNLDNVQSIDIQFGTTYWTEPITSGIATIRLLYPDGWATPNMDLYYGSQLTVFAETDVWNNFIWDGIITDVSVTYGIPWANSQGWADELVITASGYLGEINQRDVSLQTGIKSLSQYETRFALASINYTMPTETPALEGSVTPALQDVAAFTDALRYSYALSVNEASAQLSLSRDQYVLDTVFSDVTSDATHQKFEAIDAKSWTQEYYSSVTITPQAVAAVTGYPSFVATPTVEGGFSTINPTTASAQGAANYYAECLATISNNFSAVQLRGEAQAVNNATLGTGWQGIVGACTSVEFRGETIPVRIIGAALSATRDTSLWTYYLTAASNGNFFVLDDNQNTVAPYLGFGALDENRLGFR